MYYNIEEKRAAIRLYHEVGSGKKTVQLLGYPTAAMLYVWLEQQDRIMDVSYDADSLPDDGHLKTLYGKLYVESAINACLIEAARIAPSVMTNAMELHVHSMEPERFSHLSEKNKASVVKKLKERFPEKVIQNILEGRIDVDIPNPERSMQDAYKQLKNDDMIMAAIIAGVKAAPEMVSLGSPGASYKVPMNSVRTLRNRFKAEVVFQLEDRFVGLDIMALIELNPSSYGYYRRLRNNGRLKAKDRKERVII